MKKTIALALCSAFIIVCFSGCAVINFGGVFGSSQVWGSGEREIYEIKVGEFTKIKISGQCDVRYRAGSSDTATLEIQENLREYIEIEVVNGELVVRNKPGYSFNTHRSPILTVYSVDLRRIDIGGIGDFTAYDTIAADSFSISLTGLGDGKADLDVGDLTVNVSGVGDLTLTGKADTADFGVSGISSLYATDLQTHTAKIKFSGVGSASIYCTDNLSIDASGIGEIRYKGSPAIDSLRVSGLADVTQIR